MQKTPLAILDNPNYDFIIPKIQEKITGQVNIYQFLLFDYIFDCFFYTLPTLLGHTIIGTMLGHYYYDTFTKQQSDRILKHLATLGDDDFKNFILTIQTKIKSQNSLYTMQCHQWNDAYALLADKNDPFKAVFVPNEIIDCKGIKVIHEKLYVKNHILSAVNVHLQLSPKERAIFMDSFSFVRTITHDDCIKDNLSPFLIGQQGVFARIDLPKYFFLGFYSGFYFSNPTEAYAYFDSVGEGIDIYLFGHENQERPMVSAYRGGNRISLINSATDYTGTAKTIAHQLFYIQNTLPIDFKTDNNPDTEIRNNSNMFDISGYLTIKEVKAGEQLYVDYGYDYWKSKNNLSISSEEIDAIYMELKAKNN